MVLPVDIEGALFGYLKSSQLKSHEEAAVAEVDDLPWEAGSGLISMGPLLSKLEVVLLAFEAAVAEIDDLPREAGLQKASIPAGHLK